MRSPFSSSFENAISMFTKSVYLNSSLRIEKRCRFKSFSTRLCFGSGFVEFFFLCFGFWYPEAWCVLGWPGNGVERSGEQQREALSNSHLGTSTQGLTRPIYCGTVWQVSGLDSRTEVHTTAESERERGWLNILQMRHPGKEKHTRARTHTRTTIQ